MIYFIIMIDDTEEEKFINNSISPVSIDITQKIVNQMEKCVCKIHFDGEIGTGFFTKIPYKKEIIKVLITNHHVIGKKGIQNGSLISVSLNNEKRKKIIEINDKRKIYTNKYYDVTIIEILEESDGKYEYIELDDDIIKVMNLKKDEILNNYKNIYKNESIYILNYMKGEDIVVSYGLLHQIKSYNELAHKCSTDSGSSGSPILSLKDNKLIGIHYGSSKIFDYNKGTLIIFPIIEFNQTNFNNIRDSNKNNKIEENNFGNINNYNNNYNNNFNNNIYNNINQNYLNNINNNIKDFNNNNYFDNNIKNKEINKSKFQYLLIVKYI